jgi:hypothetical protein
MFKRTAVEKPAGFNEKLATFLAGSQRISDDYMTRMGYNGRPKIEAADGGRYVRVSRVEPGSRSAHSFVDMTNGDVLKPASWKAPAKVARGNIFDEKNGLGRMGEYGPESNR